LSRAGSAVETRLEGFAELLNTLYARLAVAMAVVEVHPEDVGEPDEIGFGEPEEQP
jgi:hypothetical protein